MLAMFTNAPTWAMAALAGLSVVVGLLNLGGSKTALKKSADFKKFQNNYLLVYYIITLSDWLQGTHMWTLYNVSPPFFEHSPCADTDTAPLDTYRSTARRDPSLPMALAHCL
jgi:hypothetical protein